MNNYWAILQHKKPISSNFAPQKLLSMNRKEMEARLVWLKNEIARRENLNQDTSELKNEYDDVFDKYKELEESSAPEHEDRTFSDDFVKLAQDIAKREGVSFREAVDLARKESFERVRKERGNSNARVVPLSSVFGYKNFKIHENEPPTGGGNEYTPLYSWTGVYHPFIYRRGINGDGGYDYLKEDAIEKKWHSTPDGSDAMRDLLNSNGIMWDPNTGYMRSVDGRIYFDNDSKDGKFFFKDKNGKDKELQGFHLERAYPDEPVDNDDSSQIKPGGGDVAQNTWKNDGSLASIAERRAAWQMA